MEKNLEAYNLCVKICQSLFNNFLEDIIEEEKNGKTIDCLEFFGNLAKAATDELEECFFQELNYALENPQEYGKAYTLQGKINPSFIEAFECVRIYKLNAEKITAFVNAENKQGLYDYFCQETQVLNILARRISFENFRKMAEKETLTPQHFQNAKTTLEKLQLAYLLAESLCAAKNFLKYTDWYSQKEYDVLRKAIEKHVEICVKSSDDYKPVNIPQYVFPEEQYMGLANKIGSGVFIGVGGLSFALALTGEPSFFIGVAIGGIVWLASYLITSQICKKTRARHQERVRQAVEINEQRFNEAHQTFLQRFSFSLLDNMQNAFENLQITMSACVDCCYELLQLPLFDLLPDTYKTNADALNKFVDYFKENRVSSIQEAINLYVSEKNEQEFREEMKELEEEKIRQQKRIAQEQKRLEEKRITELQKLTQVVNDLQYTEAAIEQQRQQDFKEIQSIEKARQKDMQELRKMEETRKQENEALQYEIQKAKKEAEKLRIEAEKLNKH